MCQWTPPTQLLSGHYAASVTAHDQDSATLIRSHGTQNVLSRNQHCDEGYQYFEVSTTTTKPQSVAPLMPASGVSCDINTSVPNDGQCRPVIKGTAADESVNTSATWMQIYVNSAGGFHLTQVWYKVRTLGGHDRGIRQERESGQWARIW